MDISVRAFRWSCQPGKSGRKINVGWLQLSELWSYLRRLAAEASMRPLPSARRSRLRGTPCNSTPIFPIKDDCELECHISIYLTYPHKSNIRATACGVPFCSDSPTSKLMSRSTVVSFVELSSPKLFSDVWARRTLDFAQVLCKLLKNDNDFHFQSRNTAISW